MVCDPSRLVFVDPSERWPLAAGVDPSERWPLAAGVGAAIVFGCFFSWICYLVVGFANQKQLYKWLTCPGLRSTSHGALRWLNFGGFAIVFAAGALACICSWVECEGAGQVFAWVCFSGCVLLALVAALKGLLDLPGHPPGDRWLQTLAGATFIGFFVLYGCFLGLSWIGGEDVFPSWVSPVLSLCLLLGLLVAVGGFLAVSFRGVYLRALLALVLLLIVSSNYPHFKLRFPELEAYYENRVDLEDEDYQPRADLRQSSGAGQKREEQRGLEQKHRELLKRLPTDERNQWLPLLESEAGETLEGLRHRHEDLVAHHERWRLERQIAKLLDRLTPEELKVWRTWLDRQSPADLTELQRQRNSLLQFLEVREICRLHRWKGFTEKADIKWKDFSEKATILAPALNDLLLRELPWNRLAARLVDPILPAKPKLVVLAVSGGGIRAELWTAVVLTGLEKELPNFPSHVRVITGASGGMVAAAYYVATLDETGSHGSDFAAFLDDAGEDQLTPIVHRLALHDLPMLFVPSSYESDRGQGLEEAWKRNLHRVFNKTFQDLDPGERAGWRPSLIVAPMLVEDGRQLLISNLFLQPLTETAGDYLQQPTGKDPRQRPTGTKFPPPDLSSLLSNLLQPVDPATACGESGLWRNDELPEAEFPGSRYSLNALEFFQLFPSARGHFRLGTAARMSASFPFVASAVDLPTSPRRRVVDAGYYDNYGVALASAWIYRYGRWIKANTSGVVLIQVRDGISERQRLHSASADDATWQLSRSIEWLTGPAAGINSAWQAAMSFHNDLQVQSLSDSLNTEQREFFTTVVFECPQEIALNWYITTKDRNKIKKGFPGPEGSANANALERLKEWWKQQP
jgi:hypothetical protein